MILVWLGIPLAVILLSLLYLLSSRGMKSAVVDLHQLWKLRQRMNKPAVALEHADATHGLVQPSE